MVKPRTPQRAQRGKKTGSQGQGGGAQRRSNNRTMEPMQPVNMQRQLDNVAAEASAAAMVRNPPGPTGSPARSDQRTANAEKEHEKQHGAIPDDTAKTNQRHQQHSKIKLSQHTPLTGKKMYLMWRSTTRTIHRMTNPWIRNRKTMMRWDT